MTLPYRDRREAGRVLAEHLREYAHRDDVLVLALPRGGVPVAYEVAEALDVPLDVMIVRKLGTPMQPELAMGAIASGGARVLNHDVINMLGITAADVEEVAQREREELLRREEHYRGTRDEPDITDRSVILIDDGLATGSTMLAAVRALRQQDPATIVVAVPVAPPQVCRALDREVDEVVCAATPESFGGVGRWYRDFSQTTDEEVRRYLQLAAQRERAGSRRV